jgi:hypothetical protein
MQWVNSAMQPLDNSGFMQPTFVPGNQVITFPSPQPQSNAAIATGNAFPVARHAVKPTKKPDRAPTPQELQTARMLRGAPVICNGSVNSNRSTPSTTAVHLSGHTAGPGSAGVPPPPIGLATSIWTVNDSLRTDPSGHYATPLTLSRPDAAATAEVSSPAPDCDESASKPSPVLPAPRPAFKLVRKASAGVAPTPVPVDRGTSPVALAETLRAAVRASGAEMFVPAVALSLVRKTINMDSTVAHFASSSAGDATEAFVQVLSSHNARPEGFDASDGHESLPLISALRLAIFLESLVIRVADLKKHATRTLLNLVADATTEADCKLCAAAILGILFRMGFYGDNDPHQTVLDVLTPQSGLITPQTAAAIARLVLLSDCKSSPHATALSRVLGDASATDRFAVESKLEGSDGTDAPPPSYSAATSGADGTTLIGVAAESTAAPLSDSLTEAAKRRTVYITRVDPAMSEGELRSVLLECGDFNKVRLCGETPGRCKYCFVEFSTESASKKMTKLDGRWFGQQQLRVGPAKAPIETNDPRDALFDAHGGLVRA